MVATAAVPYTPVGSHLSDIFKCHCPIALASGESSGSARRRTHPRRPLDTSWKFSRARAAILVAAAAAHVLFVYLLITLGSTRATSKAPPWVRFNLDIRSSRRSLLLEWHGRWTADRSRLRNELFRRAQDHFERYQRCVGSVDDCLALCIQLSARRCSGRGTTLLLASWPLSCLLS